jgi:mannose-6-phosphate isomerase-like protein (cupin superfamily)
MLHAMSIYEHTGGQHGIGSLVLGPDDGTSLDFGYSSLRILLRSEDTGGAFALTEQPLEPGVLAGPLHVHANEVGFFYVLEGTVGVQVGDGVVTAMPGSVVGVPRGVWHTFWNPGAIKARVLELFAPGGFERWFEDLARLIGGDVPDINGIVASARGLGTEIDFASLPALIERHGLHFPGS